jgi:hypothetical protein
MKKFYLFFLINFQFKILSFIEIKSKFIKCNSTGCKIFDKITVPDEVNLCTKQLLVGTTNQGVLEKLFLVNNNELIEKGDFANCTDNEIRYDFESFSAIRIKNKIKVIKQNELTGFLTKAEDDLNRERAISSALTIDNAKPLIEKIVNAASNLIDGKIKGDLKTSNTISNQKKNEIEKAFDKKNFEEINKTTIIDRKSLEIVVYSLSSLVLLCIVAIILLCSKDKLRDTWIIMKIFDFLNNKKKQKDKPNNSAIYEDSYIYKITDPYDISDKMMSPIPPITVHQIQKRNGICVKSVKGTNNIKLNKNNESKQKSAGTEIKAPVKLAIENNTFVLKKSEILEIIDSSIKQKEDEQLKKIEQLQREKEIIEKEKLKQKEDEIRKVIEENIKQKNVEENIKKVLREQKLELEREEKICYTKNEEILEAARIQAIEQERLIQIEKQKELENIKEQKAFIVSVLNENIIKTQGSKLKESNMKENCKCSTGDCLNCICFKNGVRCNSNCHSNKKCKCKNK